MFCSSLKNRPTWAHIVPVLLNDKAATWKEAKLESHDIAFPVFRPRAPMSHFCITLLSVRDMEASNARKRVVRLSHVSGAKGAAVLFLLGDGTAGGAGPGAMEAFMKLQVEVAMSSPMALIPLMSMPDLYPTLLSLRQKLNQGLDSTAGRTIPEGGSGIAMFFSTCLGAHITLTDRAALRRLHITSLQELSREATDAAGQTLLRKHLDESAAKKAIEFFAGDEVLVLGCCERTEATVTEEC